MSSRSAPELWAVLAAAGLTAGDMPAGGERQTPWYVRVMLGIAGLIAAAFLLGFIAVGVVFVMRSEVGSITVGLMAITAAYAIFRSAPRNDFTTMFALSVSIAGQALVIGGLFGFMGRASAGSAPWALIAAFEAALAVVMPNFIHRAGSAFGAGYAFAYACGAFGLHAAAPGVIAAAVAYIWLNELRVARFNSMVAPIGYGLTLAFIVLEGMTYFGHSMAMLFGARPAPADWPGLAEVFIALSLFVSVWVLLRRAGWAMHETKTVLALAVAAAVGAASCKAPGIAGGLMIALLGFSNANRVLTGLGIAALLWSASNYYYLLDATLLAKSGVLLATGCVLLAARWLVLNVVMRNGGADA